MLLQKHYLAVFGCIEHGILDALSFVLWNMLQERNQGERELLLYFLHVKRNPLLQHSTTEEQSLFLDGLIFWLGILRFTVVGVVANEEIWQLASVVLTVRHKTLENGWFALWWERGKWNLHTIHPSVHFLRYHQDAQRLPSLQPPTCHSPPLCGILSGFFLLWCKVVFVVVLIWRDKWIRSHCRNIEQWRRQIVSRVRACACLRR